jgi:Fe-S-cluster-containing hydrogenase component 2
MKRDVITIDESKCNGCGLCANGCPEGAIQIINGKARLVSEILCDGLGACIGTCPLGAIIIEKKEAVPYDETKVMENIVKAGDDVIAAHLHHLESHGQKEYLAQAKDFLKQKGITMKEKGEKSACGCPGMKTVDRRNESTQKNTESGPVSSELRQWPIQLHLLNPSAPYFEDADIVIAADCAAFSFGDFHRKFLKNKTLVIFCPKLDDSTDVYIDKLTEVFKIHNIKSLTLVHMEVPCCYGLVQIAESAIKASGKNVIIKDYTISLKGEIV